MLSSNSTSSAPHSVVIQSMPLGFLLQSCAVVLPAERVAFLEDALVDSRRSAARDLTRSSTPASFVNGMLSSFVLDDFGRVNFHAVSASASRLILPRELAVFFGLGALPPALQVPALISHRLRLRVGD